MKMLVGYSGFVGSNLAKAHDFEGLYNPKNIQEALLLNYTKQAIDFAQAVKMSEFGVWKS